MRNREKKLYLRRSRIIWGPVSFPAQRKHPNYDLFGCAREHCVAYAIIIETKRRNTGESLKEDNNFLLLVVGICRLLFD